jgi:hypothetical protein
MLGHGSKAAALAVRISSLANSSQQSVCST